MGVINPEYVVTAECEMCGHLFKATEKDYYRQQAEFDAWFCSDCLELADAGRVLMAKYTFSDERVAVHKMADRLIPGVWGSCRAEWIKGYLGMPRKLVRTSAAEKFYKMGKQAREEQLKNGV